MSDELSELQKHKKKISKETSLLQADLKVVPQSVSYQITGNKIVKCFKKTNGNGYTLFVGNVKVKEKLNDRMTGREVFTPTYQALVKKGLLPDTYKINKKGAQ